MNVSSDLKSIMRRVPSRLIRRPYQTPSKNTIGRDEVTVVGERRKTINREKGIRDAAS